MFYLRFILSNVLLEISTLLQMHGLDQFVNEQELLRPSRHLLDDMLLEPCIFCGGNLMTGFMSSFAYVSFPL